MAVWKAEEEAKIKLMYEVYNNREQKLKSNQAIKDKEKQAVVEEKKIA